LTGPTPAKPNYHIIQTIIHQQTASQKSQSNPSIQHSRNHFKFVRDSNIQEKGKEALHHAKAANNSSILTSHKPQIALTVKAKLSANASVFHWELAKPEVPVDMAQRARIH